MPCLVKCSPDGIHPGLDVVVRTLSGGKLPGRNPKGFSPPDRDRVFLWAIEKGYGGNGLAQRGYAFSFRPDGKAFRLQVLNAEAPIRVFASCDLKNLSGRSASETSLKDRIRRNRHPSILELTEGEAAYLDQFYPQTSEGTGNEPSQNNSEFASSDDIIDDLDTIRNQPNINETTREQLIRARLGQGPFRDAVLQRWQGGCAVTGCTQPEVLRASHVMPWRDADNAQRLNPANGILLAANIDALFDRFLISFENDGRMLVANRVAHSCRELFGLPAPLRSSLTVEERSFLAYHRNRFREQG